LPETSTPFLLAGDRHTLEHGTALTPRFDAHGLVTAIAVDAATGEVLMVAHMNAEALAKTITSREGWFYSRSRKALWRKGETSGNTMSVREIRVDCDQDAVLLKVEVAGDGAACHTGHRSCFYRSVPTGNDARNVVLAFDQALAQSDKSAAGD